MMFVLNLGVTRIVENLGVSFETAVCLVFFFGGLVFFAKDFKLGLLMNLLIYAVLFLIFYGTGLNFVVPITMFFLYLIVTSLSLYAIAKVGPSRGGVV